MTYPALEYSSKWIGDDFYTWVNKEWISDTKIPPFENDFGASDEIEECIDNEIKSIFNTIMSKKHPSAEELSLQMLHNSFYKENRSLTFLKDILESIYCIQTPRDVMKHIGLLSKYKMNTILNIDYCNTKDKHLEFLIRPNIPGMADGLYKSSEFIDKYKEYLGHIGKELGIEKLEKVAQFEKCLLGQFNSSIDERVSSMKGHGFTRKFHSIPWNVYFETIGFSNWKTMQISYKYPILIRKFGTLLHQVPISMWKLYVYKMYIFSLIKYLGTPFDDYHFNFFGKYLQGQKEKNSKTNTFLDFTYDSIPDIVSKLFWNVCGDETIVTGVEQIAKDVRYAAIARLRDNPWLSMSSKVASIEKIQEIKYKIGHPKQWDEFHVDLQSDDFIQNIFILGEHYSQKQIQNLGNKHTMWEEGIFRVNAYYFSEFNEIIFPYGILAPPFYKKDINPSWNYGGIGATMGHELCHAFDDDGKDYDQHGIVRTWWTQRDRRQYSIRAGKMRKLYSSNKILGKHLDGEVTLSENIADLAGISISLEALRKNLKERGITKQEDIAQEYRIFFISYATSWRTLYRNRKLRSSLAMDVHSPAYIRVNMVVSQVDEWYEAFDIDKHSPLYVKEEDRIHFF